MVTDGIRESLSSKSNSGQEYQNQKLEKELQVRTSRIAELIEVDNMLKENFDTYIKYLSFKVSEREQLQ